VHVSGLLVEGFDLRLEGGVREQIFVRLALRLGLREVAERGEEEGRVLVAGDGDEAQPSALGRRLRHRRDEGGIELLVGGHVAGLDLLARDGEDGRGAGVVGTLRADGGGQPGQGDPEGDRGSRHIGLLFAGGEAARRGEGG